MKIDVVLAPPFLKGDELKGCLCAVIDVLRATSTVITALASGAAEVHPCLTIDEAKKGVANLPRDSYLLGGEEMGGSIPGFDLGNSPLEYLATDVVGGKVLHSYTTNGTGAIRKAYEKSGNPAYIVALLNVSAASSAMVKAVSGGKFRGIGILCSGCKGRSSEEDNFCAGLLVDALARGVRSYGMEAELGEVASNVAGEAVSNRGHGLGILRSSQHGQYLASLGFDDDLIFASRIDFYDLVPVFDGERVTLLPQA